MIEIENKVLNLQSEKITFANVLQDYKEIKNPLLSHQVAYRYELDHIVAKALSYFDAVIEMADELITDIKRHKLIYGNVPPIIQDRIEEILAFNLEENPDTTPEEEEMLVASLFMSGCEFDGLFNEDGSINEPWLKNYLSDPDNIPEFQTIPFTPEMTDTIQPILDRTDLTPEQKDEMVAALFKPGGEYEGYLQWDGSVDASKIVRKQKQAETA